MELDTTDSGFSGKIHQFQKDASEYTNENLYLIHGGFWQILKEGEILPFKQIYDTRTAAGLSPDGKILYILVAEGENPSRSRGLSYQECAAVLKKAGSWNAMEFDGGSSTCLMINAKNALSYNKNPDLPAFILFFPDKN